MSSRKISLIRSGENSTSDEHFFQGGLPRGDSHIIKILASFKEKQIFLAFDEAKKFNSATQKILQTNTVLQLHRDKLLYTKDWRAKEKRT